VVIVPSQIIKEVTSKALDKVNSENTVRDEIKQGEKLTDIFEKHGIL